MNEINEKYMTIKTPIEIEKMRKACKLAAQALDHVKRAVKPNITTGKLDEIAHDFIIKNGGIPASLNYKGFPKSICTSVNDVVCHGIPSFNEILRDGDIVNVDIAVIVDGYHGDNSLTLPVGNIDPKASLLLNVANDCLNLAINHIKPGVRTREIGEIIELNAARFGFTSVREFVGHGIGRGYHEPPQILHYKNSEQAFRLKPGMTFTIEPMINAGYPFVKMDNDGWTARTVDGSLSAQFEHTILVTETGHEILTTP